MSETLMILPSANTENICLVRVPGDYGTREAFRHVTGLVAGIEEQDPDCGREQVLAVLEDHGFEPVSFIIGPILP